MKHADSDLVETFAELLTSGYGDTVPIESKGLDERHLQLAAIDNSICMTTSVLASFHERNNDSSVQNNPRGARGAMS